MSSLIDLLAGTLDDGRLRDISQHLGTNEDQTRMAVGAALPALVAALQRNASSQDGAQQLNHALDRDHDGSLLDNISSMFGGQSASAAPSAPSASAGDAILKHMLGDRQSNVQQGIGKVSGMDSATVQRLLAMLAPMLMGALGKQKRSTGMGPADLTDFLGKDRASIESKNPQATSFIGRMLDQDGDGDFDLGDAVKFGLKTFFGGK